MAVVMSLNHQVMGAIAHHMAVGFVILLVAHHTT
jgi:hypothetical protein